MTNLVVIFTQVLAVSKCGLRAAGAKAISEMLQVNKTLTKLDLSDNEIGGYGPSYNFAATPEGPAALADALKSNSVLQLLDVSRNALRDAGAKAFSEMLKVNKTIKVSPELFDRTCV